ncbi:MAG TPA: Fmu (Sun) domain-containing protein [Hanamia sp.]|nr:Fmu (Sun) domain-containing protein [Hanamia sp.]
MKSGELSSTDKGNHFHRYLQYAFGILSKYNGREPFHLYLKKYFSENKKHGSRDRKQITALCYNYFRLGFAVSSSVDIEEKLLLAIFLIEKNPSKILEKFKPDWNKKIHLHISEKLKEVKNIFNPEKIFPFSNELSDEINFHLFSLSFLIQPKLFIRIRPGYENSILDKLKSSNISFEKISDSCLSFSNTEKVNDIINIDKEAVIQDYNSQRVGDFLKSDILNRTCLCGRQASGISIWDCCAASGGKSILAYDLLKNIDITVSDTRKNILENLKKRFAKAGIKNYHSFITDLSVPTSPEEIKVRQSFDLIIADVPCSGSGTWSRTPEQLNYFSEKNIETYSILQKKIVSNVVKYINEGGYLLYITCSVFKKENEEIIDYIEKHLNLVLIKSEYLKGYEMQADTLFTALFKVSSSSAKENKKS